MKPQKRAIIELTHDVAHERKADADDLLEEEPGRVLQVLQRVCLVAMQVFCWMLAKMYLRILQPLLRPLLRICVLT